MDLVIVEQPGDIGVGTVVGGQEFGKTHGGLGGDQLAGVDLGHQEEGGLGAGDGFVGHADDVQVVARQAARGDLFPTFAIGGGHHQIGVGLLQVPDGGVGLFDGAVAGVAGDALGALTEQGDEGLVDRGGLCGVNFQVVASTFQRGIAGGGEHGNQVTGLVVHFPDVQLGSQAVEVGAGGEVNAGDHRLGGRALIALSGESGGGQGAAGEGEREGQGEEENDPNFFHYLTFSFRW